MMSCRACTARGFIGLPQPEQGPFPQLGVGVALGDVYQLVQRLRLVALGVNEDQLLPHLLVAHVAVQLGQLAERHAALAGPEERLLPHLDPLGSVAGDAEEPAAVLLATHLREREEHLLLELLDS